MQTQQYRLTAQQPKRRIGAFKRGRSERSGPRRAVRQNRIERGGVAAQFAVARGDRRELLDEELAQCRLERAETTSMPPKCVP